MGALLGVVGCLILLLVPVAFVAGIAYLLVWWRRRRRAAAEGRPVTGGTVALLVALGVGAVLGVILFIGLISALLIPNLIDAFGKAKQKRTLADLQATARVLEEYRSQEGSYPAAGDGDELLGALTSAGFVEGFTTTDAWKRPFAYRCWNPLGPEGPCTDYRLESPGADGVFGDTSENPYDRDLAVGPEGILQGPAG